MDSYILEERRRQEEHRNAPQECPHCHQRINQQLGQWDRVHYHCGSDRCRQAASRQNRAERLKQEQKSARARVLEYCNQRLTDNQRHYVMVMFDQLVSYNPSEGHQIAETVVSTIEDKRCKHDRIAQLEQYAAIQKRRAETTEQQLKARIEELEAELEMFNGLEATIHGIAARQLEKQPEPEQDAQRPARVLASTGTG